jgi:hypothetical protein
LIPATENAVVRGSRSGTSIARSPNMASEMFCTMKDIPMAVMSADNLGAPRRRR